LSELSEDVDLATRQIMWFQQDGAAPFAAHFARIVRDFLNNNYNERWIGRGSPVNCSTFLLIRSHISRFLFMRLLKKCCFCTTANN